MFKETVIPCDDLDEVIEQYRSRGYRLDMIVPADSPTSAVLSNGVETVRLVQNRDLGGRGLDTVLARAGARNEWITGRAGMEYRDLIPGRLGGRAIASHIRLTRGGKVPDYVHYHKVEFQIIYCLAGRIKVVYEGQGEPFWLEPGDCVLQPPEIRHRVLEAAAGSEVMEFGMPAVHETWVEHEMDLPNTEVYPERLYAGQRFVRHVATKGKWLPWPNDGVEVRDLGIGGATDGLAEVNVLKAVNMKAAKLFFENLKSTAFLFVTVGELTLSQDETNERILTSGDGFVAHAGQAFELRHGGNFEVVTVQF